MRQMRIGARPRTSCGVHLSVPSESSQPHEAMESNHSILLYCIFFRWFLGPALISGGRPLVVKLLAGKCKAFIPLEGPQPEHLGDFNRKPLSFCILGDHGAHRSADVVVQMFTHLLCCALGQLKYAMIKFSDYLVRVMVSGCNLLSGRTPRRKSADRRLVGILLPSFFPSPSSPVSHQGLGNGWST